MAEEEELPEYVVRHAKAVVEQAAKHLAEDDPRWCTAINQALRLLLDASGQGVTTKKLDLKDALAKLRNVAKKVRGNPD